jgi:hypothetical protein
MTALDIYTNQGVLRDLEKFVWISNVTRRQVHVHWNGTSEFISYCNLHVTRAVICVCCVLFTFGKFLAIRISLTL